MSKVKASRRFPIMGRTGQRDADLSDMEFRSLTVRSASLDIEKRSIEADVATENPVPMPDFKRMEMIPEILLMSGVIIPESRQVPLLDSHQRKSLDSQLGSARDIAIRDGKLTARLVFSQSAEKEFSKVREGHVTDVSAGYQILKSTFIPAGESRSFGGKSYSGPAHVATKWKIREVSLTPIGQDDQSKLRGFDPAKFKNPDERKFQMDPEFKKWLITRGMNAETDDAAAQAWFLANRVRMANEDAKVESDKLKLEEKTRSEKKEAEGEPLTAASVAKLIAEGTRQALLEQTKVANAFRSEVDSLCSLADLPDAASHCRGLATVDEVRTYLTTEKAKRVTTLGYQPSIRVTSEGSRAFVKDLQTTLTMRAIDSVAPPKDEWDLGGESAAKKREWVREKVFPTGERGKVNKQWEYATPYQMAELYLRNVHGIDTVGLPRETVAAVAWFGPQRAADMGFNFSARDAAYNTTSNFANLTLDTINKTMMVGYIEAPSTWEGPMRRGPSTSDFKNISRLRMGAIPNLPVWNDNENPNLSSFADAREYYAVECRSLGVDFSYKLLVNDDMDALSKVPANMGDAGRRTVNATAWSVVTSNPTMQNDSVALFATATGARKRTNLTTGAGAPSVLTVQTLTNLMMQMRGENTPEGAESQDILALSPTYIIGPSALRTTILQLVRSVHDPVDAAQKFNTASQLVPIIEPLLDVASTTAWYLWADPVRVDTVEVTFLQGQETPVVRMVFDERRLSQTYYVMQTYGVKAMNHRGVQRHDGA